MNNTKLSESNSENHVYIPPNREQYVITDLVAELAITLNDKANLEQEKSSLKLDYQELKQKLVDQQRNANEEKIRLMAIIKKFEERICEKEGSLSKFQNQLLDTQNKYQQEIKSQKVDHQKQKYFIDKQQEELKKDIASLKAKIVTNNNSYGALQKLFTTVQKKYFTYKKKLKYAIEVIQQLTNTMKSKDKEMVSKECQTDVKYKNVCNFNTCTLHSQSDLNSENHILAELFFRERCSTDDNMNNSFLN